MTRSRGYTVQTWIKYGTGPILSRDRKLKNLIYIDNIIIGNGIVPLDQLTTIQTTTDTIGNVISQAM